MGIGVLTPEEGLRVLRTLVQTVHPGLPIAASLRLSVLQEPRGPWHETQLFAEFAAPAEQPSTQRSDARSVAAIDVLPTLRDVVARVVGAVVDDHEPLMAAGIDSLAVTELRAGLSAIFGVPLPATLAFDYPTLASLAQYLQSLLAEDRPPASAAHNLPMALHAHSSSGPLQWQ
jgi:acyl carrier protein